MMAGVAVALACALLAAVASGQTSAGAAVSVVAFVALCSSTQMWAEAVYGNRAGLWASVLVATCPLWLESLGHWRLQVAVVVVAWVLSRTMRLVPDPTLMGCLTAGATGGLAATALPVGAAMAGVAMAGAAWRATHPLRLELGSRVVRASATAVVLGVGAGWLVFSLVHPHTSPVNTFSAPWSWRLVPVGLLGPALVRPWPRHRRLVDVLLVASVLAFSVVVFAAGAGAASLLAAPLTMLAVASLGAGTVAWRTWLVAASALAQVGFDVWLWPDVATSLTALSG